MVDGGDNMCCQCEMRISAYCKDCANDDIAQRFANNKIHPSDSLESFDRRSLQAVSVRRSSARSDEDEADDSAKNFFSPYSLDNSDVDSSSVSTRHDFNSLVSVGSSPSDSPSRIQIASSRLRNLDDQGTPRSSNDGSFEQEHLAVLKGQEQGIYDDFSIFNDRCEKSPKPLDFETNDRIWFPPPPDDVNEDGDSNFFSYADDDDELGDSSGAFSSPRKDKLNDEHQEPLKVVVQGHFRALVSQLLQSEFNSTEKWLDIITSLAWQAANFVKPDTSRGGSMDPGDYVKIKCIASGSPAESAFVKGVVCTKNIKHKRMTSQYKNARILILGGALEYERSHDQLSSIETLLQQEMDHLKMIVSRIEAHHPNVLLVEKTVSSYAQEYLLAKDISLVLNIKRSLLERVSRCTGAPITPSVVHISTTRLGQCELFRLERITEDHEIANQLNRKPSKTLMFFEGCPRRLGCTVLLKGSSREELKKVKHVVQYAIFAAYHLSLETSFLADEGASLPKMNIKPSIHEPETMNADNRLSTLSGSTVSPPLEVTDSSVFVEGQDVVVESQSSSPMADRDIEIVSNLLGDELETTTDQDEKQLDEYYSATDNNQSILVSFSSHCVVNGTVCERSRLLRIKFYGCFDKPLGRYLQDDLFDQTSLCQSCKEPAEAHVTCYTHQQGNLTINVRRLPSLKLFGAKEGKIWMWHRCLRCTHVDGVPPANHRVVMSDAAWGLSLGKFLELSFSNHATANRVASCGHSLQRDCLRFYGMGDMVAFFRYSPIDVLSVHLPPPVIQFGDHVQQDWLKKEVAELLSKTEALYEEILDVLNGIEAKNESDELTNHIIELKYQLMKERQDYLELLQSSGEEIDVFELNRLRHSLVMGMHFWDRRICSLNLYGRSSNLKPSNDAASWRSDSIPEDAIYEIEQNGSSDSISDSLSISFDLCKHDDLQTDIEQMTSLERAPSAASVLSDSIDSAWAGPLKPAFNPSQTGVNEPPFVNPQLSRLSPSPARVYSFDSAIRQQDKIKKGLPPSSLYLSTLKSFHASGDYVHMVRDPVRNIQRRSYSQVIPGDDDNKLDFTSFLSSTSFLPEGARLMIPNGGQSDIVVAVYDNEPTSIISYALTSKEHEEWVTNMLSLSRNGSAWQSFTSVDQDYTYGSYGSEDPSMAMGPLFTDRKSSNHVTIPFEDESGADGKVKFSVTCYFARQFDALREKCCPGEFDYVRSLSRCIRWSAQGGKSNVYFAKSLDERFIIKQVTKTELESFEEFAPEYFNYLTDSLNSGSPTCLAKIMGIYQVTVKHLRAGKEAKMHVLVMENVFFKRDISRVYDLKGSLRSRYNSDTTTNKTLLDMNLLEALRTNPIFLGCKAKRNLERAVWNDTSFLASIDVIDYSLLVGVDEEKKELVIGTIDFMRQYTWDKHLETWVKASGILGGPKNAAPTIISPKQYKKRFRKAMTSYFLTVPDQWSS